MKFHAALQLSIRSLRLNLLRTTLTVLGVVIGVAAIVVVFAAGDAVRNLVTEEISSYGTDIIETEIKLPKKRTASALAQITTLKVEDMEAVNKLANIKRGYGAILGQQKVSWQGQSERSLLFGVSASYAEIDQKSQPIEGRFFTAEE
ncbi:MAG TPA: ABC transporter permease, partial [bacterium]|nr:ABC transporter permease [bacterium]